MNLTVGPLPPAVYWRRRAIVVGVLLLAVILLATMCSGSGGSGTGKNAAHGTTATPTPTGQPSVLTPTIGGDGGGADGGTATATGSPTSPGPTMPAAGADQPSPQGPCTDSDLSLTAMATPLAQGFYLSMKVKNISTIACSRDLGGGPQALQVFNSASSLVWTSDSCTDAAHPPAPDVRTFGPGIETILPSRAFYWDGTLGKCSGGTARPAGTYRLVARLDTKASQPLTLAGK